MNKSVKLLLGIAIGVVMLWLSLRGVDLAKVMEAMRQASIPLILASIVVGIAAHNYFRALRWRVLLASEKRGIGLYNMISTTLIGYAISWVLPMRLGEVARPVLLAEREKIRPTAALTTVVIERFLDGLAVLALFAAALTVWDGRDRIGAQGEEILHYARLGGIVMLIGSLALAGFLLGAMATRRRWEPRLEAFAARTNSKLLAAVARAVVGLVEGGAILQNPLGMISAGALSIAVWLSIGVSTWLGLAAAGIRLRFEEIFILLPASVLGIGIPTPGGAGSYEYLVSRALHFLFAQPLDQAFAATLILHIVITLIPVVLVGLFFLWKDGVSIARLKEALAVAAAPGGATGGMAGGAARGGRAAGEGTP